MAGQVISMGRDWRGGRLTGRGAAGLAAGDALGDLSKMLFALAGKKAEEERKAAEKAAMTSKDMLPLLRLQMQLKRQAELDKRHAEEHADTQNWRALQLDLDKKAATRQDQSFQLALDRFAYEKQHGTPEERAMAAGLEAAARARIMRDSEGKKRLSPERAAMIGADYGITEDEAAALKRVPQKDLIDKRLGIAKLLGYIDQARIAARGALPKWDPQRSEFANWATVAKAHAWELPNKAAAGNPYAVFYEQMEAKGAEAARYAGEKGSLAKEDVARAEKLFGRNYKATAESMVQSLDNFEAELLGTAKTKFKLTPEDLQPDRDAFAIEYGKAFAPKTPPPPSGVTTAPQPGAAPVPAPSQPPAADAGTVDDLRALGIGR